MYKNVRGELLNFGGEPIETSPMFFVAVGASGPYPLSAKRVWPSQGEIQTHGVLPSKIVQDGRDSNKRNG